MDDKDVIGPSTGKGDCKCVLRHDGTVSVVGVCGCPVHGLKALRAEVELLRKVLREIATRPTVERNPDGDDQAAYTMQMIAREALPESKGDEPSTPPMGMT